MEREKKKADRLPGSDPMKYENSSWKPGKSRVPRGYRRNGSKPEIPKRKKASDISRRKISGYADA